jgi:hypothetical protein
MTELHELDAVAQVAAVRSGADLPALLRVPTRTTSPTAGRGRRELWQDHHMTRLVITDEHLRYIIKAGDIVATPARSS